MARRGRQARLNDGAGAQVVNGGPFQRRIPAYDILPDEDLAAIERQADWILSEIGIDLLDDPKALALLDGAGARVTDGHVTFPPGLAQDLCRTAPATFTLHARNPAQSVTLGGDHLVLMPGYGSPFVTDIHAGRRYATQRDFENFVRLSDASPWLHHSGGTVVEPTDIPVSTRHLDMVYAHLRWSSKPFMGAVTAPDRAADSLALARIVFGNQMDDAAVIQANINVNSPLTYDGVMSSALRLYAEAGQCVCISPAIFGGAMGPLTPAAMAAQTHAEILAGIALTQLVRPGCPVVYGSFHNTMSLKSGALTFGTPEANQVTLILAQLARRLGVPCRSGGGQITGANSADAQAMAESVAAMWATVMSGTHQVWHAAGWLEGGLTMGYEKFMLDLDACGAILKMLGGVDTSPDAFSRASYSEAGPGQNFLSTAHTLAHFATANFAGDVPEPGPFETWEEMGAQTAEERAATLWPQVLERHAPLPLDPSVESDLHHFMAERRAALPEAWH